MAIQSYSVSLLVVPKRYIHVDNMHELASESPMQSKGNRYERERERVGELKSDALANFDVSAVQSGVPSSFESWDSVEKA